MDINRSSSVDAVMKQELGTPTPKQDQKPQKVLSRVPRACNACRKQKMKCELGENADKAPCKRCKHAGIECLFEKPHRESALSTDAGLQRITAVEDRVRSVEDKLGGVDDGVQRIQTTLQEVLSVLKHIPISSFNQMEPINGHETRRAPERPSDMSALDANPHLYHSNQIAQPGSEPFEVAPFHNTGDASLQSHLAPAEGYLDQASKSLVLPSITSHAPASMSASRLSIIRPFPADYGTTLRPPRPGSSRAAPSSAHTSTEYSDGEDLPSHALVAPMEVLGQLSAEHEENSPSRRRSPSPFADGGQRPNKRRKLKQKHDFPDVVSKGIISKEEALSLFEIFYRGCSTFLSVFDSRVDTFESLHQHSPLAVNAICMVASQVKDDKGPASEVTRLCREEVHAICAQTLFAPVLSQGAVRALVLLSGWSSNGWLTCGHAVRMALEMEMNKAWPKLLKHIKAGEASETEEQQKLVVSARTWFCLYLQEHQMSYATGRPAILKEDETVLGGSSLLQHPLAIPDDARLVSTVELMIFRERAHNLLSPVDRPFTDEKYAILAEARENFRRWYETWDHIFSKHIRDNIFYRQSLKIQQLYAELFHDATALRGIAARKDVAGMPPVQRDTAEQAIRCAKQSLHICLRSGAYKNGLKYAVHYTHMTATFAAAFLMRCVRLFPDECEKLGGIDAILDDVEELADVLSTIPATRYARTLRLMLKIRQRRVRGATTSPTYVRQPVSAARSTSDPVTYGESATNSAGMQQQYDTGINVQAEQYNRNPLPLHPSVDGKFSGHAQLIYSSLALPSYISTGNEIPPTGITPPMDFPGGLDPAQAAHMWLMDLTPQQTGGLDAFILPPRPDHPMPF